MRLRAFECSDPARFPCVRLAYAALEAGGTAPAILNAANEIAVEAFLGGRLAFTGIARVIEQTLGEVAVRPAENLSAIVTADRDARQAAGARVRSLMDRAA